MHSPALGRAGRPKYEVADIVRAHRAELVRSIGVCPEQHRALEAMVLCRTAALGGHLDQCPRCDFARPSYNSCRNRHCPKCQALAQERWIAQRSERVLPVGHFHVVFTVPSELYPLMAFSRESLFGALFRAAADTLCDLARTKMDATLGVTAVLHTWTRDLRFHPHVHCLVTAGGLSLDGSRWIGRPGFLFSVKVLGALLRGKMMDAIRRLHRAGAFDRFAPFDDPQGFDDLMRRLAKHRWVVFCKEPFATSKHLFAYLGRYTHRVGIANSRLIRVDDQHVTFRTKDGLTTTVSPLEFLRRLVQHILPPGFVKLRHYGLYAGANAHTSLARAHALVPGHDDAPPLLALTWYELLLALVGHDVRLCPRCGADLLAEPLPRPHEPSARAPPPPPPP
jgi:ribosomal protein S27AE